MCCIDYRFNTAPPWCRQRAFARKSVAQNLAQRGQKVARPLGFEPRTTCLEGRCSIQLSYGRTLKHDSHQLPERQACQLGATVMKWENWKRSPPVRGSRQRPKPLGRGRGFLLLPAVDLPFPVG